MNAPSPLRSDHRRSWRRVFPILVAVVLAAGVLPAFAGPANGAALPVRLEAGPQTGYKFSSTGAIVASKAVTLAGPVDAGS